MAACLPRPAALIDGRARPWSRLSPRAFRRVDYGDSWRSAGQAAKAGSGFGALGFAVRASVGRVAAKRVKLRRSIRSARLGLERIALAAHRRVHRARALRRASMSGASWPATQARKEQYEGRRSREVRELASELMAPFRTGVRIATSRCGAFADARRVGARRRRQSVLTTVRVPGRVARRGRVGRQRVRPFSHRRAHRYLPVRRARA
jgi:hypothetical protein